MIVNASYHQERLWFIEKFEANKLYDASPVYHNVSLILRIEGTLDINNLEKSIQTVINRHTVLRTGIVTIDNEPFQQIEEKSEFKLKKVDLKGDDINKQYDDAEAVGLEFANRPFLIDKEPLIRGLLIKMNEEKHLLVFVIHHIIVDKYSLGIFAKELFSHYEAYLKKGVPQSHETPPGYMDFTKWQRALPGSVLNTLLSYWKRKLGGKLKALAIPTDRPRPPVHIFQSEHKSFMFSKNLGAKIKNFSKQEKTGHFVLLLAAFKILLFKYSGQEEIVVGTSGENRNQPGMSGIIGAIANLLVLRSKFSAKSSFRELVTDLSNTVSEAYKYQAMPFDKLVLALKPGKDMSRTALFDVLFQYEENPLKLPGIDNLEIQVVETNLGWGKYDLNMLIQMGEESFSGILVYNEKFFNAATISLLLDHYRVLLERIFLADSSNLKISELSILTEKEKHWLLEEWNQTRANFPVDKTVHRLFEEQVEHVPGQVAVVCEDSALTYGELNRRSNRLANYLRNNYNIKANTLVAVMLNPSLEMITAILGILKAGGAYVPINPDYPAQRIVSMLEDCRPPLVITTLQDTKGKQLTELKGISVIKLQAHVTPLRSQITNLDALPFPDRSLVDYEKYKNHISFGKVKNCISVQGTRGCPYKCAYCHRLWPKKHVFRSAQNLFDEVRLYYDMGVRRFAIIDDIFNLNRENSTRFFELIIKNGLDVNFFFPAGLRGDIFTKEYIDLMVRAGVINFAVALETASPRLQKLIGKNLNIEKLRENIAYICKKHPNVILELFTMHGFPSETEEEALSTLDFIKSQKWLHFPYINILRIYLNTDMEKLAIEHGISRQDIIESDTLSQHDFSKTLPFDRSFTTRYQSEFLNEYFLSKERLLYVLPHQMKVFTRDELAQRYDSYLPSDIRSFEDFMEFAGIKEEELIIEETLEEQSIQVVNLDEKIRNYFPEKIAAPGALRLLLLDLSQFFKKDSAHMLYDVHEPPLGLMNLMTYLRHRLGEKIVGKIAKSRIDFDSYPELKEIIEQFKPDIIGIRGLTFYKDFFHKAVEMIRFWGVDAPIIAGGPYATSDYETILQDRGIKLVVKGEGEETFAELIKKIIENDGKLPGEEILKEIKGLAFIPGEGEALRGKFSREILFSDELKEELAAASGDDMNIANVNQTDDLAYVIFTSGSTGKPKGCMISHKNVVRLLKNDKQPFDFDNRDTWIMAHSFCFDFSIWEIYGALLYGGRLIIPHRDSVRDVYNFHSIIRKHDVSILNQTPGAFYNLTAVDKKINSQSMDKYLRCVIFGGDKLLPLYLHDWLDTYPLNKIKLINMYGITETTVHVTYHYLSGDDISVNNQVSNIGKALPETTVYILNENLELQPVGIPGELYIGGSGVCRGYLNRGALTGERFIKNPYNCEEVIYRSGDLGRWLHDGRLEYIGRIDHQVKIRGFRIELGEIETQILTHDDIDEAVVIVREDSTTGGSDSKSGDKYLCAYIVSKNGKELSTSELRDYLSNRLPGYMVPAYFVRLAEISLTLNGKIDRKSLPDPELKAGEEYTAPRNYPEKKLVEIFSTVLGLDEGIIGIESDFFEYGGHSVNAINIIAKIHKELNVKIQIGDLFRKPTVRELGEHIMGEAETKYTSIVPSDRKEYYPLSAGQKKLFIIQRMYPQNISYNIFRTFYLEHFTDNEKLQEVFKKLIERHDSLRISFRVVNDEPVQFIHNNVDFEIEIKEGIEESEIRSIIYNFTKPFDLSKAPLLRICLINAGKNSILLVDMHHIISDGTSHEILQKDFLMLYEDKELPRLRLQYKDYIVWQNSKEYRGIISRQEKYWSNMFSGEIAVLDLPADFERPEMKSYEGSSFTFTLNKEETAILKDISKGEEATLFMTIFAVFNVLFSKLSGMEDITIGIAAEGRRHNNLKNILGLFVNLLPIRSYVDRRKTFKEFLQHIKKQVLDASENQEYQFENMLEKISVKQDNSRHPLFDVVINMANRPGTRVNIDGIVNQPGNENDNKHKTGTSQYDMTVTAVDCGERIQFFLQYCTKLYKLSTIERYMKYFKNILYSLSVTTDKKMSGIEIITQEEQSGFLNINSLSRR